MWSWKLRSATLGGTLVGLAVLLGAAIVLGGCASTDDDVAPAQSESAALADSTNAAESEEVEGSNALVLRGVAGNQACTSVLGSVTCHGLGSDDEPVVVEVSGLPPTPIEVLEVGRDFACALNDAGEVWCWGSNDLGQLGVAEGNESSSAAVLVEGLPVVDEFVLGRSHACASTVEGVWCWGSNAHGQVKGVAATEPVAPTEVWDGTLEELSSSGFETCGVQRSPARTELVCWGNNKWGQIDPTLDLESLPPTVVASVVNGS